MTTKINKLLINEAGTQLVIDIESGSPTNKLIHSISICKGQDLDFTEAVLVPNDPILEVSSADIADNDISQLT